MTAETTSPAVKPPITVRPVETVEEYRACQVIQRRAWGITEDSYVVPVATMISVQHAGGLVLGAFEGKRMVGFAFGYLGRVEGQWVLYSQLAGVDPTVQDRGVGGLLKQAQRAWAKEQGLALVAWSFDPTQAGNANFNLHRLGAHCHTYQVNYFGERTDTLNAGVDTDRLLALWPVEDTPRRWLGEGMEPSALLRAGQRPDGLLVPAPEHAPLTAANTPLTVEIPTDFAALKERDPALARAWQLALREAMLNAFAAGYVAMDFLRESAETHLRARYLLRRPAA